MRIRVSASSDAKGSSSKRTSGRPPTRGQSRLVATFRRKVGEDIHIRTHPAQPDRCNGGFSQCAPRGYDPRPKATLSCTVSQGRRRCSWKTIPRFRPGAVAGLRPVKRFLRTRSQASDDSQQGCLSAAAAADNANEFSGIDRQKNILQGEEFSLRAAEGLACDLNIDGAALEKNAVA